MPDLDDGRRSETLLQEIVDTLAERLERSVAIDDHRLRLVAASRHFGDHDPLRIQSLLDRELTPENLTRLRTLGIASWTEPGVLEAVPEAGSYRRICIPLRHLDQLFGYLWLIDPEATLTDVALEASRQAGGAAARVLHRESLAAERRTALESARIRDLLGRDLVAREQAAQDVRREHLLGSDQCCAVLVMEFDGADHLAGDHVRDALRRAVDLLARDAPSQSWLHLIEVSRLTVVATAPEPWPPGALAAQAENMCRHAEQWLLGSHDRKHDETTMARAGVGSVQPHLEYAFASHDQAGQALWAGRVLCPGQHVTAWDRLGVYGTLLGLMATPGAPVSTSVGPAGHPTVADCPDPVLRLMAADREHKLVATLELYLDEAGDAVRTAARLHLHRTTLHYRLRRIEELAGVDLSSGQDRLVMHIGIKLARLGGALPGLHRDLET